MTTGGPEGWIQSACEERFTCHLDILRLMTWGFDRLLRFGLSRCSSMEIARRHVTSVASAS